MSLVMPWASVRVSRELVRCVMIRGVNRVQKIMNTWTLGVVQAVKVLCDFGPSLFGYTLAFWGKKKLIRIKSNLEPLT
jgi:hypothetical protein